MDFTKDSRPLCYKTSPSVFYHDIVLLVRPIWVFSRDESGLSEMFRFQGVVQLLRQTYLRPPLREILKPFVEEAPSKEKLEAIKAQDRVAYQGCIRIFLIGVPGVLKHLKNEIRV